MKDPDDDKTGRGPETSFKAFRFAGPLFGAGIQMAAAVVLMFFVGRWLDEKFDTGPWLMLAGLFFGAGGGLYTFIRTVNDVGKEEEKQNPTKQ